MAAVDEVDVYDSWEDIDEIGLERKISKFLAGGEEQRKPARMSNGGGVKVVFDMSDPMTAQIMAQQPSVKILKRPSAANGTNVNGENKSRPVKTFQQRQQDYESLRLRILGEARCPEDIEDNITSLQIKMEASNIQTINRIKEKPVPEQLSAPAAAPAELQAAPSAVSAPVPISAPACALQPRLVSPAPSNLVNLVRSPRGPDGSKGFLLRR